MCVCVLYVCVCVVCVCVCVRSYGLCPGVIPGITGSLLETKLGTNALISELSHVRVQLRFQIRTYIYVCGRTSSYVCTCSVVCTVGGV